MRERRWLLLTLYGEYQSFLRSVYAALLHRALNLIFKSLSRDSWKIFDLSLSRRIRRNILALCLRSPPICFACQDLSWSPPDIRRFGIFVYILSLYRKECRFRMAFFLSSTLFFITSSMDRTSFVCSEIFHAQVCFSLRSVNLLTKQIQFVKFKILIVMLSLLYIRH